MPTGFAFVVKVDGTDVAPMVLEGARIDYGRSQIGEQPSPPSAVITLLTEDAYPEFGTTYPEFGLGDHSMPSGYVDTYADLYAGPSSRITIGSNVTIDADSGQSGYSDTYVDTYYGDSKRRFTGYVVSIDYSWDEIRLTAVAPIEILGRVLTGETGVTPWPEETDLVRAARIWPTITLQSGTAKTVVTRTGQRDETAFALLSELAKSCEALFYSDRFGQVIYRSWDYYTPHAYTVPGDLVMRDQLAMSLELGAHQNYVEVGYGTATPQAVASATDSTSVSVYGQREVTIPTMLSTLADAQAYANRELTRRATGWHFDDLTVNFALATEAEIADIASADLGDSLTLSSFLNGSPVTTYTAYVLGYTESLSDTAWQITYHLTPAGTLTE